MERVLNEEKINRIIDALLAMQEREDVTIPALRRQLAETEKGIANMLNAIQQGICECQRKSEPSANQYLSHLCERILEPPTPKVTANT